MPRLQQPGNRIIPPPKKFDKEHAKDLHDWINGSEGFYPSLFDLIEMANTAQRHQIWQGFSQHFNVWFYWKYKDPHKQLFKRAGLEKGDRLSAYKEIDDDS